MVTYHFFNENHSLAHLNYLTLQNWNHYFKLSSKSLKMQLLCEFNNYCQDYPPLILGQVSSSKIIGEYLENKIGKYHQEILYCAFFDTKNQIIHEQEFFKVAIQYSGTGDHCS